MMTENNRPDFVPFQALNQFMTPEFRLQVIGEVFKGLDQLPAEHKGRINGLVRKLVQVPGFRNSALAPLPVRVRGAVNAFERNSEFVVQVLQGWADLNPELAKQVHKLLKERKWSVASLKEDRSTAQGFKPQWDKAETYEALDEAFTEMFPKAELNSDKLRLMIVWMSGCLPFDIME